MKTMKFTNFLSIAALLLALVVPLRGQFSNNVPGVITNTAGFSTNPPAAIPQPVQVWGGTNGNPNGLYAGGQGSVYNQFDATGTNFVQSWVKQNQYGSTNWVVSLYSMVPFTLPYKVGDVLAPTNFWTTNVAPPFSVELLHPAGTSLLFTNAAHTIIGMGQALLNAEMDPSLTVGDVIILSSNLLYSMDGSLTNQGFYGPLDFTSQGTVPHGVSLVAPNGALIDCKGYSFFYGNWFGLSGVTFSNFNELLDAAGDAGYVFATNQFNILYQNSIIGTNYVTAEDVIVQTITTGNWYVEGNSNYFNYDFYANGGGINASSMLISHKNFYHADGQAHTLDTRVQFGCMGARWYSMEDTIICSNATAANIGIEGPDFESIPAASSGWAWKDNVTVVGANSMGVYSGGNPNTQIFLGFGNSLDAAHVVLQRPPIFHAPVASYLTSGGFRTVAVGAGGSLTANVICTNAQAAWLTNATTGEAIPLGAITALGTNYFTATMFVNAGDSVCVTNFSGTPKLFSSSLKSLK